MLDNLFEETDGLIHQISEDGDQYGELLDGLILQGAYALMEQDIVVRCREDDVDQVNASIERIAEQYEEAMGFKPSFSIGDSYLAASRYRFFIKKKQITNNNHVFIHISY